MTWRYSINVKQYLRQEDPVSLVAANVQRELQRLPGTLRAQSWAFDDIITGFEEAGEENDVELFDNALADLYDWADEHRVWLGLKR